MPTSSPPPKRLIVLLSGGLDSAVLASLLMAEGHEIEAISFDYGQRHRREIESARAIAVRLGIMHLIVDIRSFAMVADRSSLTGSAPVPHGHYAEESMKSTVVPNRNTIFVAYAAARAISAGMDGVAIAAHAGDHTIYPDCRAEWVSAVQNVIRAGNWDADRFEIHAPFLSLSKADIVGLGAMHDAPMRLTWSCYEGGLIHCGRCGTCIERKEAFSLIGLEDPTEYAA